AEELLHVLRSVLPYTVEVVRGERDHAEPECDVEVGRRWREPRDEPDQVADEDEDEERREERDVTLRAVPDHALGEAVDRLDEGLGDVAACDPVPGLDGGLDGGEPTADEKPEEHE